LTLSMTTIEVEKGQTIWDVACQYYGSAEGAGQVFHDNADVSFDTDLEPGQMLLIDETKVVDAKVVKYLKDNGIKLNTGEI
jgi:hypothetical protein